MADVVTMISYSNIKSSLWVRIASSILTGLFGSLLLILFLTGLMPLGATVKHLPWILGFNASVAGYTLLDRTRVKLPYKKLVGVGVGLMVATSACGLLNILALRTTGMGLVGWTESWIFITITSVFGGLGAWLSIAYSKIKEN